MRKNAIVTGTGFEGRDEIIRKHCNQNSKVTLIRQLHNSHDPNAIAVHIEVPVLFGLLGKASKQIGFIKASSAKSIAKKMDAGVKIHASMVSIYAPDGINHPRVTVEITDEV
jgi:hypothetical protein